MQNCLLFYKRNHKTQFYHPLNKLQTHIKRLFYKFKEACVIFAATTFTESTAYTVLEIVLSEL